MAVDATEDELILLFDAALDAVVSMRVDGTIAAWNRQAEATFGWRREQALGQSLASLIIPAHLRDAHSAGLRRFLKTGEGPVINRRIEISALHQNGHEFPAELTILPLREGEQLIFFAFVRDITEAKNAKVALERRALEAQVLYEATAMVADETPFERVLQTCLTGICRASSWAIGHVYFPNRSDTFLIPSDVWHSEEVDLTVIRHVTADNVLRPGEGLPGRIWTSKKPEWIADIATDTNFPRRLPFAEQGIRSAFGFPILGDGKLLAVLEFFSQSNREPDAQLYALALAVGQQLGRAIERRHFQEHQQILVNEMSHRMRNLLAVVNAVFQQTLRSAKSTADLAATFGGRLQALGAVTQLMTETDWKSTSLEALIKTTLGHLDANSGELQLSGPHVNLAVRAVMPLSLVLHELATNAAKYGALSQPGGKIVIGWSHSDRAGQPQINLVWSEQGGPAVVSPQRQGYGTELIRRTIEHGLHGSLLMNFVSTGLEVVIDFPLPVSEDKPPA